MYSGGFYPFPDEETADGRNGRTYDNEERVLQAMGAQGFVKDGNGIFQPYPGKVSMRIPKELIPKTPEGGPVAMNLRADRTFAEDAGWHKASASYARFLRKHKRGHVLYLELGVGSNTPVIIKFPFWVMTSDNPETVYACLNYKEAFAPIQIADQTVCIDGDAGEVLAELKEQ